MYSEYFKRIDKTKLYPAFALKLEQLIENCLKRGVSYWVISGLRTWVEQDALYAQGRDKTGKVIDKTKIVTNAKGGQSNHNFSVAVDFCNDKDGNLEDGLQPNWDNTAYQILAEEAEKLGLEAGLHWKFTDADHIQLNLTKHGLSFDMLRTEYLKNKDMADVWKLLDKQSW